MSKNILIVEDNELNRDVLTRRLRRRGFVISAAHDGLEALEKVNSEKPDLVLMDMNLPGLNGWEATEHLRGQGHRIPIIALTAHATPEDRARCLEAGCDEFATKPVDFSSLLQIIERFIGAP